VIDVQFEPASIRFLFRTYEGSIDRRTWRTGVLVLLAFLIPLTVIWLILAPATHRDLSRPELVDARALFAFLYLILFTFTVILIAVCWTNLSAKRFRAIGWPGAFAGLLPFAALIDGAAHWFQPRAPDVFPDWALIVFDAILAAVALWSLYELGLANPAETGASNRPHR
jgi:uncharacterized membrane protein YhaH (DUF805 family)